MAGESTGNIVLTALSRAVRWLADTVAPRSCAVCGRELLPEEEILCLHCLARMPHTSSAAALAPRIELMVSNGVAPAGFAAAWFDYDPSSPYADLIRLAKYDSRPRQAELLGRMFGEMLTAAPATGQGKVSFADVDVLLPVPLHWRRRLHRGFNQSEEIARGLAEVGGMAVGDNLVARRHHTSQTRKGGEDRRVNIAGTMAVENPGELDGLHVAIVDDIVTTGSTVAEAVHAISRSGARPASIGMIALGVTSR